MLMPICVISAHRGSIFLPWHREFLRRFELDLQKEVSDVTLPYWDWAADASLRSPDPEIPSWTLSPFGQKTLWAEMAIQIMTIL